jgi:hypothetical protein
MKKKMLYFLIFMAAIVGAAFLFGTFLPNQQVFEKRAILKKPVDKVFQIVTDFARQKEWRSDVKTIEIIDATTWKEVPKTGTPLTFKMKTKIDNELFEIDIIEPKSFNGSWEGRFKKTENNGTALEFKEIITISNPFFRTISYLFVDLDNKMTLYLENLKRQLGE